MTPTQTLDSLREAVRLSPRDPALRRILADAYLDDGDDTEAEWHRDLADVSEGGLSPSAVLDKWELPQRGDVLDLANACREGHASVGPGFGAFVHALWDDTGRRRSDYLRTLLSKKIVTGRLWHVFPDPDHDTEGEGFHGLDTPPCEGEWVADLGYPSYWVVHPTEPACIGRWATHLSTMRHRKPGRILHADAAGISYLQHWGEDDTMTVRLYY